MTCGAKTVANVLAKVLSSGRMNLLSEWNGYLPFRIKVLCVKSFQFVLRLMLEEGSWGLIKIEGAWKCSVSVICFSDCKVCTIGNVGLKFFFFDQTWIIWVYKLHVNLKIWTHQSLRAYPHWIQYFRISQCCFFPLAAVFQMPIKTSQPIINSKLHHLNVNLMNPFMV